ncbi:MAG: hypothetical protein RL030_2764 [Pseudomonadota bacterium]|jgi:hypothetical protein
MVDYFQGSPVLVNAATTLSGIQELSYRPNIGRIKPRSDGRAVHCLITEGQVAPAVELSTLNLAQVHSLMATSGELPYVALTGFDWYERKVADAAPTFAAGSVHEKAAAILGTLFFTGLDCNANDAARISLSALFANSTGSTHPVTFTQAAVLTDPLTIAPFTLDSVTIDGTDIPEVESVSIRAAVTVQTEFGMKPYPRIVRPRFVDWSISVRHNNKVIQRTKTDKSAAIAVVLKSLNTGGPTRGTGTSTWTVTGLLTNDGGGQGQDNSQMTSMVEGRHDGSNQPATWSYSA